MRRTGWRSTRLRLASEHCLAALRYADEGRPYDRSRFAVGTAAHAVLEDIGVASVAAGRHLFVEEVEPVARQTCERLISEGRAFDGEREPPLPPAAVWSGRDFALAYQRDFPLSPHHRYEIDLAVTRDWIPCPYQGEPWLRAKIDATGSEEPDLMEDAGGSVLVVLDFKSAWSADEEELRTLQRKIQALLAWRHYGEGHDAMRLVVVNFRLRRSYDTTIYPNTEEGAAVLERWRGDVVSEIERLERDEERAATPGAGCFGCPYLGSCDPARAYLVGGFGGSSPEELATTYSVALAILNQVKGPLQEMAAEAPIEIDRGLVGIQPKEFKALRENAPQVLAELWSRRGRGQEEESRVPGLLTALKLTATNADALLAHMYHGTDEEREKRARALHSILTTKVRREFGLHRSAA